MTLQNVSSLKKRNEAFTLIELLVVIVVVAILLALSASVTSSVTRGGKISAEVSGLADELTKASLESVRRNRPVHFRFYRLIDPDIDAVNAHVLAYQALILDSQDQIYVPLDGIRRFTGGVGIHDDTTVSTILNLPQILPVTTAGPGIVTDPLINGGSAYTYYEFEFRPDGSTNLPKDQNWGLVLAAVLEGDAGTATPADGWRAIEINAFTGAVKKY